MLTLPKDLAPLGRFRPAFTRPTYERFLFLCLAAIVAMGRRTVSRLLWSARCLSEGHPSSYHRFFSAARWSTWATGRVLAAMVLELVPPDQPVVMEFDDTVAQHGGKRVYGKGWHRDAVRSSHGYTTFVLGHRWVTLAVNVKLPLCVRCWALPVLSSLYVPPPAPPPDASGQVRLRQQRKGRRERRERRDSHEKHKCKRRGPRRRERRRTGGRCEGCEVEGCEGSQAAVPHEIQKAQKRSRLPVLRKRDGSGRLPPRHKTTSLLARQMVAAMLHWFPDRRFIVAGDWGFASHELALFCHRHGERLTLVARYVPDATLYALPPTTPRTGRGRKPRKGRPLPSPREAVGAATTRRRATVAWYGAGVREVEMVSGRAGWYRARGSGRAALVPVRWVWAKELAKGQEAWFYSTDPSLAPERIIELFAGRWAIEVTFEEVRAHLGFATTRQRCRASVLRAAPCLLGLFSLVSLLYAQLAAHGHMKVRGTPCYPKTDPTFADALAAVRAVVWEQVILPRMAGGPCATEIPPLLWELLLDHLAAAA